jgi:hypothetical protein
VSGPDDKPRSLEDSQVLGDRRHLEIERFGELVDRRYACDEARQDRPSRRARQRGEHVAEFVGVLEKRRSQGQPSTVPDVLSVSGNYDEVERPRKGSISDNVPGPPEAYCVPLDLRAMCLETGMPTQAPQSGGLVQGMFGG